MNIDEAIAEIESTSMVARLGVASDFRTFVAGIKLEPAVHFLYESMHDPKPVGRVLSRISALSRRHADCRYENPWDTALAVYLWMVAHRDRERAKLAAAIVSQAPQCWWATKLSRKLLEEPDWLAIPQSTGHGEGTIEGFAETVHANSTSGEGVYRTQFLSNVDDVEVWSSLLRPVADASQSGRHVWPLGGEISVTFASDVSYCERTVA